MRCPICWLNEWFIRLFIRLEKPNATTIAAIEENHSELERHSTTDDMFAALDAEEKATTNSISEALLHLPTLSENWDTEGSPPVSKTVLERLRYFFAISPYSGDGSVDITFVIKNRRYLINLADDGDNIQSCIEKTAANKDNK